MLFQFIGGRFGGGGFQGMAYFLEQIGFLDAILPFVIVFTILFAVLQRIKLFEDKKINAVIAAAIGLLVIVPHLLGTYPPGADVVVILNNSLPEVALVGVGIVLLLILTGLFKGATDAGHHNLLDKAAPWVSLLILVVIFVRAISPTTGSGFLGFLDDPALQSLVIILLIFALVVWIVVGGQTLSPEEEAVSLEARAKAVRERKKTV